MLIGSSISDIAQSSLSEDIFKELVPLSTKQESMVKSIRHSLSLKSSCNSSVRSAISPLKINTAVDVNQNNNGSSSIKSPLNEFIISSSTRSSSKQSDSSDSSLTSLSSTEEFAPLHPISRSDPAVAIKKMHEDAPLIEVVNQQPQEQQAVPALAMARMKERHRQEYRRSMQWSPPKPSVNAAPAVEYPSRRANSFNNQRIYPIQPSPAPSINSRVQLPLIN